MSTLISKLEKIPVKNFLYKGSVNVPNGAKTFDIVKILNDNRDKVDIITFRDKSKASNILRRYIITKSSRGLKVIERNYKRLKDSIIQDPESSLLNAILPVQGRKISAVTKLNGEFWEKSEETQTLTLRKNKSNVVHIKKIVSKMFGKNEVEDETQSLYEYRKDAPKKGYTVKTILKSKLGFLNDIFPPQYSFENFSEALTSRFTNDPYFLLHLYSNKEFQKIAPTVAKHPKHNLIFEPEIKWCSRERGNGFFGQDDTVKLNKKTLQNKLKIINTAAHEKEHAFQEEQCIFDIIEKEEPYYTLPISFEKYEKYKKYVDEGGKYKIYSQDTVDKYWSNMQRYISPEENLVEYSEQIMEKHANLAGAMAEREFQKSSRDLKEEFLFAPDDLIGVTFKDIIDRWAREI